MHKIAKYIIDIHPPPTTIRKTFQAQGARISYSKGPKIRNRGPTRGAGLKKLEIEVSRFVPLCFAFVFHIFHRIVTMEILIFLTDALIYSGLSCSIHPVITFIMNVHVYFFVASAPTFSEARDCCFSVTVSGAQISYLFSHL